MKKPTLTVVMPFYNEEKTLLKIIKKVLSQGVFEIIAVNDGSQDGSLNKLEAFVKDNPGYKKKLRIFSNPCNLGKGAALILGVKQATGDFIVIQDGDLEYNPADYKKMIYPILKKQAQFVIGNRWSVKKRGYLLAQAGNFYMNVLTNLLFRSGFGDSYSCYKLGPAKIWKGLKLKSSGFEIEAEITGKLAKKGIKIHEVPISYRPRTFKEGKKINWKDIIKGTKTLLQIRFNLGIYKND